MPLPEHPFDSTQVDNIARAMLTGQQFAQLTAGRFETEVVLSILRHYKLGAAVRRAMEDTQRDLTGQRGIMFSTFNSYFVQCPVYFVARHLSRLAEDAPVYRILSDFGGRRFTVAYRDFQAANPEIVPHKPLAMVFNWPYLKDEKYVVLHNWTLSTSRPGVKICWNTQASEQLTLEALSVLLSSLDSVHGKGWTNIEI